MSKATYADIDDLLSNLYEAQDKAKRLDTPAYLRKAIDAACNLAVNARNEAPDDPEE